MDTIQHTIIIRDGETHTIDDAQELAPGLVLFRLPDDMAPNNPRRWRIGHKPSGLAIADAMRHEDGITGVRKLADMADWTQDKDTLQVELDVDDVFIKLSGANCVEPNCERMTADVSRNGTYTDDDIRDAAAEAKAEGYNALDVLVAMSATVPWSGLDTEPFNEAHDRIVTLADIT